MNISEDAANHWPRILTQLGINSEYLTNRHMPCPGCGGKDRFRFDDKEGRGTFYCNGGGSPTSGDGFALLQHVFGWSFATAANEVRNILYGECPTSNQPFLLPSIRPLQTRSKYSIAYAKGLWDKASKNDKFVTDHPYSKLKKIPNAAGAARGAASGRVIGHSSDCIILPQSTLRGRFVGVECINPEGIKQTFGKKGILILGDTGNKSCPIYVVEGWADGVATWQYFGEVIVVIVFGKARQDAIGSEIEAYRPNRRIILVRDSA
jgi:putative DNA primase/helicase